MVSKKTMGKIAIGVIFLISLFFVLLQLPNLLGSENIDACIIDGKCLHEERLDFLSNSIPLFIAFGVLIGAIVYYLMVGRLEKEEESLKFNTEILLQFLNKEEKKVIEKLIENKGSILQSEITRLEGMGKVKSHRIIQRLIDRKVIELEKYGKTNILKLTPDIMKGLF